MFQKLIILAIISLSFEAGARAPSTYSSLRSDLQRVSQKNLSDWVNAFIKEGAPSRMVSKPGHDKARDYIQSSIKGFDSKNSGTLTVTANFPEVEDIKKFYQNDFDQKVEGKIPVTDPAYMKWQTFNQYMKMYVDGKKAVPVQNIIWEKAGINSKKVLVVTAHYDTISHNKDSLLVSENDPMPGANYNASGVVVALGLVKTLAQMDLNYSVQVVFLDWQGLGFHGSYLHAKELKKLQESGKEILGVVNLEMLGQDTSFFDKTKKTGNMSVYVRDQSDEVSWVNKLTNHGTKITQKVTFEVKPTAFDASDNFRYWDAGLKSATFSQNWEDDFNPKFYQTAQDTPDTLNHETLWNAYQYVGGAVIGTLLDLTK